MTRSDGLRRRRGLGRVRGFSYLWVLLLVAAMGLGSALALELYTTSVRRDKEQELIFIGRQFRAAIARYRETVVMGRREYPSTLDDLLHDKRMTGGKRHLRRLYIDPMTGKAEWGLMRMGGRIVGVYSLSEKVPIKQAHFEAEEALFVGKEKYSEWVFAYPFDLMLRGAPSDQNPAAPAGASSSPLFGPAPAASSVERNPR